jgi:beta-lactamase superfamily II metal-dependent hydrolase
VKLKAFFATDGDCLLLTSGDGHHALIDGGRTTSFREQAWGTLQQLQQAGEGLDLVVVSHIDNDHVSGILWLLEAVREWTVFDHHHSGRGNNPGIKPPKVARPPAIAKVWHNSWLDQIGDLARPIEDLVSQIPGPGESAALDPSNLSPAAADLFSALQDLGVSIPAAMTLRTLIERSIPATRNKPFKELVLLGRKPHVEPLGSTSLTVIGPKVEHLEALREEWRDHLSRAEKASPAGSTPATRGPDELSTALMARQAERQALLDSLAEAAEIIEKSNPSKVSPPNRASITLLAEESGRTCLLTGDAAEVELLDGLKAARRIKGGRFHCDILKVQHHGSEYNLSRTFAEIVSADHYVFCGDGAHHNPDPSVVKTIVDTRPAVDPRPFTLWFNCSPARTARGRRAALAEAIGEAEAAAAANPDITVRVLPDDEPFLELVL